MSLSDQESHTAYRQGATLETVDFAAIAQTRIRKNEELAQERRHELIADFNRSTATVSPELRERILSRLETEKNPGWRFYNDVAWDQVSRIKAATMNNSLTAKDLRFPAPYTVRKRELEGVEAGILGTFTSADVEEEIIREWRTLFDVIRSVMDYLEQDREYYTILAVLNYVAEEVKRRCQQGPAVLDEYLESEMTTNAVLKRLDELLSTRAVPPPTHDTPEPEVPARPESHHSSRNPSGAPGQLDPPETTPRGDSLTRQLSGVTRHLRQPESPSPSGSPSRGRRRLRDRLANRFKSVKGALSRSGSRGRDSSSNSMAHSRRLPLRYPAIYGDL